VENESFQKKRFDYLRSPNLLFIFAPKNNKSNIEVTFNEDYMTIIKKEDMDTKKVSIR